MERSALRMKRTDAIVNKTRIIEVALAVFTERGLDIEMGEVAARAGLGVGTLYRHFTNRDDLLRAILFRAIEDTLARFRASAKRAVDDPCAALQSFIAVGVQIHQFYGPLFSTIRDPRLSRLFDQEQAQTLRSQFLDVVMELLQCGVQAGIFRDDLELEIAAATIIGSFIGTHDLLCARCSSDELAQKLFRLHLAMLTASPCQFCQ